VPCVLQCVAVCYSVLQCVAVYCSVSLCVAVCCSVLQCVAVCWPETFLTCGRAVSHICLQRTAICCNTRQHIATHCNTQQHIAIHYNTLMYERAVSHTPHFSATNDLNPEPWTLNQKHYSVNAYENNFHYTPYMPAPGAQQRIPKT